jgi:hypothetical protein
MLFERIIETNIRIKVDVTVALTGDQVSKILRDGAGVLMRIGR